MPPPSCREVAPHSLDNHRAAGSRAPHTCQTKATQLLAPTEADGRSHGHAADTASREALLALCHGLGASQWEALRAEASTTCLERPHRPIQHELRASKGHASDIAASREEEPLARAFPSATGAARPRFGSWKVPKGTDLENVKPQIPTGTSHAGRGLASLVGLSAS